MAEFTKGEWQTVFFKGMSEQEMYVKVSGGACICKILDTPSVEKKANARLIAAAPDLLAVCEKIQNARDDYRKTGKDFDYKELDRLLEAAIKKAKT